MKDDGLIKFDQAKTPLKTISSRIGEEIDRNGTGSIFVRIENGVYFLREKLPSTIGSETVKPNRSFFIVIEGIDGAGKTEIAYRLAQKLRTPDQEVKLEFEPNDPSCAGYYIRQVLNHSEQQIPLPLLALAFATNRVDHYTRVIKPFLEGGDKRICICDRYYISSIVYQSASMNTSDFDKILELNSEAKQPDLTLFLTTSTANSYKRLKNRQGGDRELFDKHLDAKRMKYKKVINYLKEKRGETIIEVNANHDIDTVLNDILGLITGEDGKEWITYQEQLIKDPLPPIFSFSTKDDINLAEFSSRYTDSLSSVMLNENDSLKETSSNLKNSIKKDIDNLDYNKVTPLFTDLLRTLGYKVGEMLGWTALDAFSLEYEIPHGITLQGAAIIIYPGLNQTIFTKRVMGLEKKFEFMFILDLRTTRNVKAYPRDTFFEGEVRLSPSTSVLGRSNISDAVFSLVLKRYLDDHLFYDSPYKPIIKSIIEQYQLSEYWKHV